MIPTYTFFAVDKGNMTLVEFPNGIRMLVDCRQAAGRPSPLEYLRRKGVGKLDFVVITHPHQDHLTGLKEVCEALRPTYLWHNGRFFKPDPVYEDWSFYELLRNGSVGYCEPVRVRAGQAATIGSARIVIAGPPTHAVEGTSDDENNNGIILSITSGSSRVVLTGDTQIEQWESVDITSLANPSVFLASHHGRENGYCPEVLSRIKPQHVVISDGPPDATDATEKYKRFAPVSTTRASSIVVRPGRSP